MKFNYIHDKNTPFSIIQKSEIKAVKLIGGQ